jgi:hypothetical protein
MRDVKNRNSGRSIQNPFAYAHFVNFAIFLTFNNKCDYVGTSIHQNKMLSIRDKYNIHTK